MCGVRAKPLLCVLLQTQGGDASWRLLTSKLLLRCAEVPARWQFICSPSVHAVTSPRCLGTVSIIAISLSSKAKQRHVHVVSCFAYSPLIVVGAVSATEVTSPSYPSPLSPPPFPLLHPQRILLRPNHLVAQSERGIRCLLDTGRLPLALLSLLTENDRATHQCAPSFLAPSLGVLSPRFQTSFSSPLSSPLLPVAFSPPL